MVRQITVHAVRDLVAEPLTLAEFAKRPYLVRSRWLVNAVDHEAEAERQFYLGSSPDFAAPPTLRFALYERESDRPTKYLAREFGPTLRDRRLMLRLLNRYEAHNWGDLQIRVTAYDLRLWL